MLAEIVPISAIILAIIFLVTVYKQLSLAIDKIKVIAKKLMFSNCHN